MNEREKKPQKIRKKEQEKKTPRENNFLQTADRIMCGSQEAPRIINRLKS